MERPIEPADEGTVTYCGWECGFNADAAYWTGEGWQAAKGGFDLDALTVTARTFNDLLTEIDDAEDDA